MALLSALRAGDGVLLVVNPGSRRGAGRQIAAVQELQRAGLKCDVLVTEAPGHAAEAVARAGARYAAVFTLGGDGTVMEVAAALVGQRTPVGVLPGGTGNLIARAFGIPLGVRHAVRALLAGGEASIDLGRLGDGRCFAFAAGVGVDAYMVAHTPARWKRRLGVLAYTLTAARGVLRYPDFQLRAEVDGQVLETRARGVMLANFGTVLNRLLTLGPGIRHDDGKLDLCVFSPSSAAAGARIVWRLSRRDFRPAADMLWLSGRRFRIETDPPLPAQADGDLLGMTPFSAEVIPLAVRLLVPAHAS